MNWARLWPWHRPIEIVPISTDDAHGLSLVHAQCFSRGWTDGEITNLLARPTTFGFKAFRPGLKPVTCGFILVVLAADEGEILTIAVAPAAQRTGLGERLMRAAMARLAAERASSLFLEVEDGNAGAIALYRKLGFKQVGRRDAYYAGATRTGGAALVMRRDL